MKKAILLLVSLIATLSASAQTDPWTMTAEYYMNQPFTPDTAWHFSPARYREMSSTAPAGRTWKSR